MNGRSFVAFTFAIIVAASSSVLADEYIEQILPFMKTYCIECHAGEEAKGELDLVKFSSNGDVISKFRRWKHVIEFIRHGEMPPKESPQPSITESNAVVAKIEAILIAEARKQAGDPGVVLPRRLSNSEYNHAIHDLTGVNIEPTKSFPVDPAGGEGFDNTGEALRMSPNLVKKYLTAAQLVADHMVLKPNGIAFAPFPVQSYNERKKLTEQAVIDFYESHAIAPGRYIEASWRYRHRSEPALNTTIEQWAATSKLSPKYLEIVWSFFNNLDNELPLEQELKSRWDTIPAPSDNGMRPAELNTLIGEMSVFQRLLTSPEPELIKSSAGNWPISHLDFRAKIAESRDQFDTSVLSATAIVKTDRVAEPDRKSPTQRSLLIRFDHGFSEDHAMVVVKGALFTKSDRFPRNDEERERDQVESLGGFLKRTAPQLWESFKFGRNPDGVAIAEDAFVVEIPATIEIPLSVELQRELKGRRLLLPCTIDKAHSPNGSVLIHSSWNEPVTNRWSVGGEHLIVPNSQVAQQLATTGHPFCQTFPNRFFYVNESRGLAAGFHLVEGFFRDDRPLVEKVLSDQENAELDRLWSDLNFVTESAETLLRGFVWFERSEREVLHDERFGFLRSEDPHLVEENMLGKFERLYLDKMGIKRVDDTLDAETPDDKYAMIHGFFEEIREGLTTHRELLTQAEQRGLADTEALAQHAWRRKLRPQERVTLNSLYRKLRNDGQTAEEGLRGVLTAVLMSPHFCYYAPQVAEGTGVAALDSNDLATRLSLFLWSSLPDDELLLAAENDQLQSDTEMRKQINRMLRSPKVSAFAEEFFGQWLRYRDFLEKDPINGNAFSGYDDELRTAMAEEPVRLATFFIQADRPITDLLSSDSTIVNRRLATHYGGVIQQQYQAGWGQFDGDRTQPDQVWLPVTGIRHEGRSGLLGMAVVLAKNSAGERTSPVKRGFWTAHHLLGQHFPPPPADVPELPNSEKEATHTIRELLAAHVADAKCAMCHKHFDSLGLAMEGFDAVGRRRTTDSAGRPIDNQADLPNGGTAHGIPELVDYIEEHRREEFVETFCRKFLGYALGRSVLLSDEPLLSEMKIALKENDNRFSILFETVVFSPQFRYQRARDFVVETR